MTLVTNNQSAKVLQSGEEAFDLPAAFVPAQRSAILGLGLLTIPPVRRYHLDALLLEPLVKRITVIGFVSDEPLGSSLNKRCSESRLNKGDFMWRSTFNVNGEWKRRAICNLLCTCHDLRTFAPLGLSNATAPFFATTKVPSMKRC
jgi:hypothetical protein